jgi:hypothetical protein
MTPDALDYSATMWLQPALTEGLTEGILLLTEGKDAAVM